MKAFWRGPWGEIKSLFMSPSEALRIISWAETYQYFY